MDLSDGLVDILKGHLGWNKARLSCFVGMLLALVQLKRMNLAQLALGIGGDAKVKSRYRRLQRFFKEVEFNYDAIAHLIVQLFDLYDKPYYLTLDRTNWKWGQSNLNILTLGIVYKGAAIPVYWLILNKQGNSSQRERIALLKRFIKQFRTGQILGVLGDREFIGDQWWQWLTDENIPYLIRMKENQKLTDRKGRKKSVKSLFSHLASGNSRSLRHTRKIGEQWVWLNGMRLETGELLILASNQRFKQPFVVYGKRWEIENLFQCLKGRGFHLEDTRLTHYSRIKKVIALLAIAFCWAHKTGEWQHKVIKPIKLKSHGRKEQSLFRYGLDFLTERLMGGLKKATDRVKLWALFLCPPDMLITNEFAPETIRLRS